MKKLARSELQGDIRLILVGIDTSTTRAAVALSRPGSPPRVVPPEAGPARRHGQGLIPSIAALLDAEGLKAGDLGAIAVGLGPGSYTGLRIGLTAAKTLAYAIGKPLVGLDSLDIIARNAPEGPIYVAVAVDAQRGDAYIAEFARTAPGAPLLRLGPTRIEAVEAWSRSLGPGTLVLGPALEKLLANWPDTLILGSIDQGHPDPARLIPLALETIEAGRFVDPFFVEPFYLRRSAAEDQWDARKA